VSVDEVSGIPIGVVGRFTSGPESGLYIEVDDDTERPRGSGGYYVLLWDGSESADEWYATADDLPHAFEGRRVEWLSAEEARSPVVIGTALRKFRRTGTRTVRAATRNATGMAIGGPRRYRTGASWS
jgi:hypothetical protein